MLIRCAWCGRVTGNKPPFGGGYDKEITDGICDECQVKYFPNVTKLVKDEKRMRQPL